MKSYQASRLRRTHFRHFGDVIIDGPVEIKNILIVVGDLTVRGDLNTCELFCFGNIRIDGDLKGGHVVAVGGINIKGNAIAETMESGSGVSYTAKCAEMPEDASNDPEEYFARRCSDWFYFELEEKRQGPSAQVTNGGYLDLFTCDIQYGLEVKEWIDIDRGTVSGQTVAQDLYVEGHLDVYGSLFVSGSVQGCDVFAVDITVGGNVDLTKLSSEEDVRIHGYLGALDIDVKGALSVEKHFSAYGKVTIGKSLSVGEAIAVKRNVEVGEEYGVLCGLRVPRSEWPKRGWISSPKPPKHLFTGVHIKNRDFDEMCERLLSQ